MQNATRSVSFQDACRDWHGVVSTAPLAPPWRICARVADELFSQQDDEADEIPLLFRAAHSHLCHAARA